MFSGQLTAPAVDLDLYDWAGRAIERHQTQNLLSGANRLRETSVLILRTRGFGVPARVKRRNGACFACPRAADRTGRTHREVIGPYRRHPQVRTGPLTPPGVRDAPNIGHVRASSVRPRPGTSLMRRRD
jgi:hypothetical protein